MKIKYLFKIFKNKKFSLSYFTEKSERKYLPEQIFFENKKQKKNFLAKGKILIQRGKLLPLIFFFFTLNKYLVVLFPIVEFSLVYASSWCASHRSL
jgi:hypothetical protein